MDELYPWNSSRPIKISMENGKIFLSCSLSQPDVYIKSIIRNGMVQAEVSLIRINDINESSLGLSRWRYEFFILSDDRTPELTFFLFRYEDDEQTSILKADWIISAFGSTLIDENGIR